MVKDIVANTLLQNEDIVKQYISSKNTELDQYRLKGGESPRAADYDRGAKDFSDEEIEQADRYATELKKINDGWKRIGASEADAADIADDLAQDYINFNKGYEDILDNWEDYIEILETADASSMDYVNTLAQLREDLSLMFDIPSESLSDEFLKSKETAELLEKAAKGDLEAITELRENAALDILPEISEDAPEQLREQFNNLINEINNSEE